MTKKVFSINTPKKLGSANSVPKSWTQVQVAPTGIMAKDADDFLFAWGSSGYANTTIFGGAGPASSPTSGNNVFNLDSTELQPVPHQALGLPNAQAIKKLIFAGHGNDQTAYAITQDGDLYASGFNTYGVGGGRGGGPNFGDSTYNLNDVKQARSSFTQIFSGQRGVEHPEHTQLIDKGVHDIDSNRYAVGMIKNDGTLHTWGYNHLGQLGANSTQILYSPVQIGNERYRKVLMGMHDDQNSTMALRDDHTLYMWGSNEYGQLGITHGHTTWHTIDRSSPNQVTSGTGSFIHISSSGKHSAAIDSENRLYMWGYNNYGQLGVGNIANRSSPTQVPGSWSQVETGYDTTYALTTDNQLFAWGRKHVGSIPEHPFNANRSSPIALKGNNNNTGANVSFGLVSWTNIAAIDYGGIAVEATTNTAYVWGSNDVGQLGLGDSANKSSFVAIGTHNGGHLSNKSWYNVDAGPRNIILYDPDGKIYVSGGDYYGATGRRKSVNAQNNKRVYRSFPIQVSTVDESKWYYPQKIQTGSNTAFKEFSVGQNHGLAIDSNDKLWGWGNFAGRDFFANTTEHNSWKKIASAHTHSIGLTDDGEAYAWGENNWGQLGTGEKTHRSSPVQIPSEEGTSWIDVDAGTGYSALVRSDKTLWTMGRNEYGQLGPRMFANNTLYYGTTTGIYSHRSSPIQIGSHEGVRKYKSLGIGQHTSYALDEDGNVFAWGRNGSGSLGDMGPGGAVTSKSSPVQLTIAYKNDGSAHYGANNTFAGGGIPDEDNTFNVAGNFNARRFSAVDIVGSMADHAVILDEYGRTFHFGLNTWGPYGFNDIVSRSTPYLNTVFGQKSFAQVSLGSNYGMYLTHDGQLWTSGHNPDGRLGDNTVISRSSPVQISHPNSRSWSQVSAGFGQCYALDEDYKLWGWGRANMGRLGPSNNNQSSPVQTDAGFTRANMGVSVISMAAGGEYSGHVLSNNALYMYGTGTYGQLGKNDILASSSPIQIASDKTWKTIHTAQSFTHGITTDKQLWGWGDNRWGSVGDNTIINRSSPVQIAGSWNVVATGGGNRTHNCLAIKSDGTLWSWGYNAQGQLGLNDVVGRSSPVQIGTKSDWTIVAANYYNGAAINANNELFVWGDGPQGSMGDNTAVSKSSPIQVTGSWQQVVSGDRWFWALSSANQVFGWGYNNYGHVSADTTKTNKSQPVQVATGSSFAFIGALSGTACMGDTNGKLFAVGYNGHGAVGDGTTAHRSTVTAILTQRNTPRAFSAAYWNEGSIAREITGGYHHWQMLDNSNTLFAWGHGTTNQLGQMGTGLTTPNKSSPVQVYGNDSWVQICARFNNATIDGLLAIKSDGTAWIHGYNGNGVDTYDGSLGINEINSTYYSPVQVSLPSGFDASGKKPWFHGHGGFVFEANTLSTAQTVYGWGRNEHSTLGSRYFKYHRSSPVLINSGKKYKDIKTFTTTTAGGHSLGVDEDDILWSWGGSYTTNHGELGFATLLDRFHRSSPTQVKLAHQWRPESTKEVGVPGTEWVSDIVSVSCGRKYDDSALGNMSVLTESGNVFSWGHNATYGGLGDNTVVNRSEPVQLGFNLDGQFEGISFSALSTHAFGGFAIGSTSTTNSKYGANSLWGWGRNDVGMLSKQAEDVVAYSFPIQVDGAFHDQFWTKWDTYRYHGIGIANNGTLWVSGYNQNGCLGQNLNPTELVARSSPIQVGTANNYIDVAAGDYSCYAIKDDGKLFAWGYNAQGQLGQNDTLNRSSPVQVRPGTSFTSVSTSYRHVLATTSSNNIVAWGENTSGQCGINNALNVSSPTQIGISTWSKIKVGIHHSLAIGKGFLNNAGGLYTWGYNVVGGVLGQNNVANLSNPTQIGTHTNTNKLAAGYQNTKWINTANQMFVVGYNTYDELGQGDTVHRSSPVQLAGSWTEVTSGYNHAIATAANGTIFGWGLRTSGQVGDGTTTANTRDFGIQLVATANSYYHPNPTNVSLLYSGVYNSGIIDANNKRYEFGTNEWGHAGRIFWAVGGAHHSSAVQVTGNKQWQTIAVRDAVGGQAIQKDTNKLWAWGYNSHGELGLNNQLNQSSPTQIWGDDITSVTDGMHHTIGWTANTGKMYMVGYNDQGQIGQNDVSVSRSTPTQITGEANIQGIHVNGNNWSNVWGGERSVFAELKHSNKRIYAWGYEGIRSFAKLGLGYRNDFVYTPTPMVGNYFGNTEISRFETSLPAQIGNLNYKYVAAGNNISYAISDTDLIYSWGNNREGQLGRYGEANSEFESFSPVQIGVVADTYRRVYSGNTGAFGIKFRV